MISEPGQFYPGRQACVIFMGVRTKKAGHKQAEIGGVRGEKVTRPTRKNVYTDAKLGTLENCVFHNQSTTPR